MVENSSTKIETPTQQVVLAAKDCILRLAKPQNARKPLKPLGVFLAAYSRIAAVAKTHSHFGSNR
jgi:hypothetical protein